MSVIITKDNIHSYINGDLPVLIDVWATWCGPCKAMGPAIDWLAEKYQGRIVVGKCDAETNDQVCEELGIKSVPTVIVFQNGQEIKRVSGLMLKDALDKLVTENIL